MIPKKIHYCWFGNKEKSLEFKRYLETWKKHLPDYEIKEWNESNFDLNCCRYCKEAYLTGNYSHVSDVCRVHALLTEGGIYLDTDVEILKSFNPFLEYKAFAGLEFDNRIGTAVIGSEAGVLWLEAFMNYYRQTRFINIWGHPVRTPNTKILTNEIMPRLNEDNLPMIFPVEFFSAKNYADGTDLSTMHSVAIHHYAASWRRKKSPAQRVSNILRGLWVRYYLGRKDIKGIKQ